MTAEFHAICQDLGLVGRKGSHIRPVIGLILECEKHYRWPERAADMGCCKLSENQFDKAVAIIRDYRARQAHAA